MELFKKLTRKSRQAEVRMKVNSILTDLEEDKNNFTESEKVSIMIAVCERYREVKTEEMTTKYKSAHEIKDALNKLTVNQQIKIDFP
jgi:hypothetical protein